MSDTHDSLVAFPETEQAYQEWVAAHPHGCVINVFKPHTSRMVWHEATCFTIQPNPTKPWVTGDFIKACSNNPGALAAWAKGQAEELGYCEHCRHKWLSDQQHQK